MSLKDFKPDEGLFDDDDRPAGKAGTAPGISASRQEEINTLKIDKLSNRITIISIILPCIIGVICVFAYLDMKERVVDVDQTKNTQVQQIARQFEDKLNALDVRIAQNRFDVDKTLPDLMNKLKTIDGQLGKLSTTKVDTSEVNSMLAAATAKVEKVLKANTAADKKTADAVAVQKKKSANDIASLKQAMDDAGKRTADELDLFKEELDARLLQLTSYEQQFGELGKNFSLMDKRLKRVEQDRVTTPALDEKLSVLKMQIDGLSTRIATLDKKLQVNLTRLQKDLDILLKMRAPTSSSKPTAAPPASKSVQQQPIAP